MDGKAKTASSSSSLSDLVELDLGDDLDEVDVAPVRRLKVPEAKKRPPSTRKSITDNVRRSVTSLLRIKDSCLKPRSHSSASRFELKDPGFGLVNFFTLKVLFVDLFIAGGDVVSDFAQGVALLQTPNNEVFGFITIGVNWLPGVVAAVHLISMYRAKYKCRWILLWAALLLLLYPVVPVAAYVNLLWQRPKEQQRKKKLEFRESEYLAAMAHSISGGIESPIQLILQLWLIVNGKIPKPWSQHGTVTLKDWHGNELHLPTTAAISLVFSAMSIAKAVIDFNILRVHIEDISSGHQILRRLELTFEHLPFLAASAFFRIGFIVLLLTYLNAFAFFPVGLFWLCCLAIGYRSFNLEKIPLWLISFISIFFPICFTVHPVSARSREKMISLQYKTFFHQSVCSVCVYFPALAFAAWKVNVDRDWAYDPNVILGNLEFNAAVVTAAAAGAVSAALSRHPNWFRYTASTAPSLVPPSSRPPPLTPRTQRAIEIAITDASGKPNISAKVVEATKDPESPPSSEFGRDRVSQETLTAACFKITAGLAILLSVFAPIIVPQVLMHVWSNPFAYVAYMPRTNSTRTMQAVALTPLDRPLLKGCLHAYDSRKREDSEFHYPICPEGKILQVEREDWPDCRAEECYRGACAVILVDGRTTAGEDDGEAKTNAFRPSFPTSDIERVPDLALLLVQSVDSDWALPDAGGCVSRPCEIYVAADSSDLPNTDFSCDATSERRIPYDGGDLIDRNTGKIRGQQYRTVSCRWGERDCFGFSGEEERRDFCDGPGIHNFFRSNGFPWYFDDPLRIGGRIFDARGSTQPHDRCLTESRVRSCDSKESPSRWSEWLRCDRTNPQNLIRKRYCQASESCLIQEKKVKVSEEECRQVERQT